MATPPLAVTAPHVARMGEAISPGETRDFNQSDIRMDHKTIG